MKLMKISLGVLLVATLGFVAQNPDPASGTFPFGSVVAGIGTNSARTGASVSRAGYAGAFGMVAQGHVTNGAGAIVYWVVQDSVAGGTWTNNDSIIGDTVDNKGLKVASYRGTKPFLRMIQRATSAGTDTTISAGVIILTNKRSR